MSYKINLLMSLVLILTIGASGWPSRRLHLEIFGTICTKLTAIIQTFNCTVYKANTDVYYFNDVLTFSKDLSEHFELRVRIDSQYLNTNVVLHVLDYKLDVCSNLKGSFQNIILRILMLELRRSSNLPFACPFKADKFYKLENFTLTEEIFPPYTPEANFTVTMDFFYKKVQFAKQTATGAIHQQRPK